MTSTRKERALKKRYEEKRAEALGCTPQKGVNHGYNHLKHMREAKARNRADLTERARQGEDVDTRHALNRDVTEVRKLRKEKRKEARERKQARGMTGEVKNVKSIIHKYK